MLSLARNVTYEAIKIYRVRRYARYGIGEAVRHTVEHLARCLIWQYRTGSPIAGVAWSDFGTPHSRTNPRR
jgi:hypothetical protein